MADLTPYLIAKPAVQEISCFHQGKITHNPRARNIDIRQSKLKNVLTLESVQPASMIDSINALRKSRRKLQLFQ